MVNHNVEMCIHLIGGLGISNGARDGIPKEVHINNLVRTPHDSASYLHHGSGECTDVITADWRLSHWTG